MRIYGGHDYYDSALAYGADPTVVLVRYADRTVPLGEAPALPRLPLRALGRSRLCDSATFHYITVAFGPKDHRDSMNPLNIWAEAGGRYKWGY
jgi:hypothetical protein